MKNKKSGSFGNRFAFIVLGVAAENHPVAPDVSFRGVVAEGDACARLSAILAEDKARRS